MTLQAGARLNTPPRHPSPASAAASPSTDGHERVTPVPDSAGTQRDPRPTLFVGNESSAGAGGDLAAILQLLKELNNKLTREITKLKKTKHGGIDEAQVRRTLTDLEATKMLAVDQFPNVFSLPYPQTFTPLSCMDEDFAQSRIVLILSESGRLGTFGATYAQVYIEKKLEDAKACKDTLEAALSSTSGIPSGVVDNLNELNNKLAREITKLKKTKHGGIDEAQVRRTLTDLEATKMLAVDQFPNVFSLPYPQTFTPLSCMDEDFAQSRIVLILSESGRLGTFGATYAQVYIEKKLEDAKACKDTLEAALTSAGPSPSPSPSPTPGSNTPPQVSGIGATFYPKGLAGACEDTASNVNFGETCYTVSASDTDGDTLTYAWSLAPPVQDPTCATFHALSPPTTSVWHHGDEDSCDHTKMGSDGHEGTVTLFVKDGSFTCIATYLGTNTGEGPAAQCFASSQTVLSVTKAGTSTGNGTGTVTSSPPGISCATSCLMALAQFPMGSSVTLTATPDSSSTFVGWTGPGCSGGPGQCTLTLGTDENFQATFAPK